MVGVVGEERKVCEKAVKRIDRVERNPGRGIDEKVAIFKRVE